MFDPVGARSASWSKVKASPPAFKMRSFAEAVKRRAAMVSFGIFNNRTSSVTVPTLMMTFEPRSGAEEVSLIIFDKETGGRLVFERKRRWSMTWFERLADALPLRISSRVYLIEPGVCAAGEETVKLSSCVSQTCCLSQGRNPLLQGGGDKGPRSWGPS